MLGTAIVGLVVGAAVPGYIFSFLIDVECYRL